MKTLLINAVTYYVGRTQQENHTIIDRGTATDLWFHLANISSCHVVAILPSELPRKERGKIIKQGAKQWTAKTKSLKDVEVTYAPLSAVKKERTPGSVTVTEPSTIIV